NPSVGDTPLTCSAAAQRFDRVANLLRVISESWTKNLGSQRNCPWPDNVYAGTRLFSPVVMLPWSLPPHPPRRHQGLSHPCTVRDPPATQFAVHCSAPLRGPDCRLVEARAASVALRSLSGDYQVSSLERARESPQPRIWRRSWLHSRAWIAPV